MVEKMERKGRLPGNQTWVQVQKTRTGFQFRATIPFSMAKGAQLAKGDAIEWIYAGELLGFRKVRK